MAERNQHFDHPQFDELLEFIQQNANELLTSRICAWDQSTQEIIRRERSRYPDIPPYPSPDAKTRLQAPVFASKAGRSRGEVREEAVGIADAIVSFTRYSLVFVDPDVRRIPSWRELVRSTHCEPQEQVLHDEDNDEVSDSSLDSETDAEAASPWHVHEKGSCELYLFCCPHITSAGSILRELQKWRDARRDTGEECFFGVVSSSDRWKELFESQGFVYWHVTDDQLNGV